MSASEEHSPESAQPESAQAESARADSARAESTRPGEAQAESAQPGEAQTEGAPPEGGQPEGAQPPRVTGQSRPGRHAVSKPGLRAEAAATAPAGVTGAGATGAGTTAAGATAATTAPAGAAQPDLSGALAERTADLQRVQAEYANYRKRVERDRAAVREHALASVMSELLPVLDDIGRAREHGELTGGFKSVGESLEAITVKLGLTSFGEAGEVFDPNVHEALTLAYSADVTEPTCAQILQPGYRVGDRVLRPARVVVAEPTDPAGARTGNAADLGQGDGGAGQADESAAAGAAGTTAPAGSADDTARDTDS